MGRRRAVEVPRRRLARPVGRAGRRRDRDAGVREPALRAGRARAAARGLSAEEVGRAADRGRRRPRRSASSASSTRRPRGDLHRRRVLRLGRRPRGRRATRRRGTSSSRRETVDAMAAAFEAAPAAARRAPPRGARRRAGGGRRPARPAGGGAARRRAGRRLRRALGRRRRPARRRPPAADRGAGRLYGLHEAIFGRTPREEWLAVDEALAAELRERLAGSATTGDLARRSRLGGTENYELRVDGIERVDPVVLAELRRDDERPERLRDRPPVRDRAPRRTGPDPAPLRHPGVRRQRVDTREEGDRSSASTTRADSATRSCTSSPPGRATFTVDGETIDAPAGTIVFVARPRREARGARARSRDDDPRRRREARRGVRASAWEENADVIPFFETGEYELARRS